MWYSKLYDQAPGASQSLKDIVLTMAAVRVGVAKALLEYDENTAKAGGATKQ